LGGLLSFQGHEEAADGRDDVSTDPDPQRADA
jgi:hypothetical protein